MGTVLLVIFGIIMFGLLIAVHEFGHFITAKLCGVKVNEFAIGMGPKLLSKQGKETLYSLRLFPIGGFCAMEGEDEDTADPRSFQKAKEWKKLLILVAGAAMNFVIGVLIFVGLYLGVRGYAVEIVGGFESWSRLPEQGLQVGDEFLSIDGHEILVAGDASIFLDRAGAYVDIEVLRDGKRVMLEDVDMARTAVTGADGQVYHRLGLTLGSKAYSATFGDKLRLAWNHSRNTIRLVWMGLGDLVTGKVGLRDVSGPVGIVDMMGQVAGQAETTTSAFLSILSLVAFIAINLAVMNLLPIPALDGGRIFFLLVNAIFTAVTKKRLDPKYEGVVNAVFLVGLLVFMAVVAASDVMKIFGR